MKIKIVDAMMGKGKTSWAINFMNERTEFGYVYITPFLDEVDRVMSSVEYPTYTPKVHMNDDGNVVFKKEAFNKLLIGKKSIVSTHSLFASVNDTDKDLITAGNYVLILDEVMSVVDTINISASDLKLLINQKAILFSDDNEQVIWNDEFKDYRGKFTYIKDIAKDGRLIHLNGNLLYWKFPVDVFKAFNEVIILTYKFRSQIQHYYYQLHNIEFDYYSVDNIGGKYKLIDYVDEGGAELRDLINIVDDEKLNSIGNREGNLSSNWFNTASDDVVKSLKNNVMNYYMNREPKVSSKYKLWTTFNDFRKSITGKGYSRGFLQHLARATNEYQHKTKLAYVLNKYMLVPISQYFGHHDIKVDQDDYALSEMLQWI
ncbi:MAG: hypothetical protein U9N34_10865, partial [Candidatus Cloacimonadota bacterium]|nr:hypothetical protein [Candidatus Cloacimonadota bacterium]